MKTQSQRSVKGSTNSKKSHKVKTITQEEAERRIKRAKIRDEIIFMLYLRDKQKKAQA